ncbi:SDR family oxidoreductase [Pedobacter antarcticus]|uniref:SDR family NAD(P)-dependent oxidoreductase n=1 Tax=Pedobacter antarcticus TaxID=34086 RepID=UPI00292E3F67|nr:SDR family oxidoreductase [Pedobacter antarcticus]
MQLKDKTAIITGGAAGIGKGLVRNFVKEGANVLFVDINEDAGLELEKELGSAAKFLKTDITAVGMEERILTEALENFGGELHILVNNAQASKPKLLLDVEQADLDLSFNTGLWATWKLMRASYTHLAKTKGTIINFASDVGLEGLPNHGACAMNKEAIRGLTRTAAKEWGHAGIRINVICPGTAVEDYKWWRENHVDEAKELEDIAPIVVFLASDASHYMTGQTIMADGGSMMLR